MAQSVEQLIRNQQVAGSSPAISSKNAQKLRLVGVFSYKLFWLPDPYFWRLTHKYADYESVLQKRIRLSKGSRLTFDPHGNTKRKAPEMFRCFLFFYGRVLHGLRHEAAHLFCGFLLCLVSGMCVVAQSVLGIIVSQRS